MNSENFKSAMLYILNKDEDMIIELIKHFTFMTGYDHELNAFKLDMLLNVYQEYKMGE